MSSLFFKVERSEAELIAPAKPTPCEFKLLSDIDDEKGLRRHKIFIQFYAHNERMQGRDPVEVIRKAIADTLVFYYPFAGRLKEGPNDKLMVECNGEGVMFIEANADVRLDHFGDVLLPPFQGVEDLLYVVPGSEDIINCPLLLIQVTRFTCGGFSFALRLNHTMADGTGIAQFIAAVAEMACGAHAPSVKPVWEREILCARDPPRVLFPLEFHSDLPEAKILPLRLSESTCNMAKRSFFFSSEDFECLRNHLPPHLRMCTKFEILTTCLWRCRTMVLNLHQDDQVRVAIAVNARAKFNPPLPVGYYGNVVCLPVATSTVHELCQSPLAYSLELIQRAKNEVNSELLRSLADILALNGRTLSTTVGTFYISDLTHMGFRDVDFGWGKAVYGGPTWGGEAVAFLVASKNKNGEDGIIATMELPEQAMKLFTMEIEKMIRG